MMKTIDAEPRVRLAPPPPWLMRIANPLVRRILATAPLGRRLPLQALLEFEGRRTGRRRRVPVCLHDIDGAATVFTERPWRFNFAGGATVTVTHRGQTRTARGRLLDATPGQVGRAIRIALDNGATPFQLGLKVPRNYDPTSADLAAIPRAMIRISFDDSKEQPCASTT